MKEAQLKQQHQPPDLICTKRSHFCCFSLSLYFPIHLLPFFTVLHFPLIHLAPLSLRECCDKTELAGRRATIVSRRRDCHWTAVFDYPLWLPQNQRTLNSAPFHFLFCALWLKIADSLVSTPSAQTSGTCLHVLASVAHPRLGLVVLFIIIILLLRASIYRALNFQTVLLSLFHFQELLHATERS